MKNNRYIYPAIFEESEGGKYSVSFPDLPGCITEGDTVEEAFYMAQDALKLHLYSMEKDEEDIPTPTLPSTIKLNNRGFVSLVDAWMPSFRKAIEIKSVKKTLTIPKWLNDLAEQEDVNFSYLLQRSVKEYLKEHSNNYLDPFESE